MSERSWAALRRRPLRATAVLPALLLAGCGGGSNDVHMKVTAHGPRHLSALAFDRHGRLWATSAGLTGHERDGLYLVRGRRSVEVAGGLVSPLGLVWVGDRLFVSSLGKVTAFWRFDGHRFHSRRVILDGPVADGENNNLVVAPDGRLVMGVSASCDHCTPSSRFSAAVVSFRTDGSDLRLVARGIRAPFGLAYRSGALYVTMNQRDDLGSKTPGDWLAVVRAGQDWGFPICYGQQSTACSARPKPLAVLDAHAAAGGVAFLGSTAVVAEWQTGKVLGVSLDTGHAVKTLVADLENPLAVIRAPDGSVLVGDWSSGTIYRLVG